MSEQQEQQNPPLQQPPQDPNPNDRPGTPPRPPYSPVTPVFAHLAPVPNLPTGVAPPIVPPATSPSPTTRLASDASIAPDLPPPAEPAASAPLFAPAEPAPVPISETDNPDAIALRSALSILQMQKQQSLRDIRALERLKTAAAADPEAFARELAAGRLSAADPGGFVNFTADEEEEEEGGRREEGGGRARLDTIPTPQNVVRMPPVNWAKYQVVGEPLDKMHEEQRRRPLAGDPRRDSSAQQPLQQQRAPEHLLASPYRPLVDRLETPAERAKTEGKNKKT
ncbi:hypothetical protein P168DRAFT_279160 [Aspergillus campestris IBT 28561]|uniref:Uncharacterized protein n=1 Tax=Aspergillus campestris (strain IBT 28561) TaxID=1392248 RepID=A0A2I1DBC4_ASPC2|nr:uncharacterized protein P168DRAFT_279160 [Aspergillus campestris IBT 28561]PKY07167.1 hypothetical protein P168DRAFT_279160 [Aspergillus campestris IBT 28561]